MLKSIFSNISAGINKKSIIFILLLFIFLLALYLRLYSIGEPYLLGYDSFFWYRQANFFLTGDSVFKDPLEDIRANDIIFNRPMYFFSYFISYTYKFFHIFLTNLNFLDFCFLIAPLLSALSIFVIYFLVKITFGKAAGLFSAIFFGLSPVIIYKGTAGELDNDPLNILFILIIFSLFFYSIKKIDVNKLKLALFLSISAGFFNALLSWNWDGYWLPFWIIILTLFFHFFLSFLNHKKEEIIKYFKKYLIIYTAFFASFFSFSFLLMGKNIFEHTLFSPFNFIIRKTGAKNLIYDSFPSVQYSVSELKPPIGWFHRIIYELGTASFFLGITGFLVLFIYLFVKNKDKKWNYIFPFISIFFLSTLFPFLKAAKFAEYLVIPLSMLAGFCIVEFWKIGINFYNQKKRIAKISIFFLIILTVYSLTSSIFIAHFEAKRYETSINAELAGAFNFLRDKTNKDSIVIAWWDYGYFISALTNRKVAVDGGTFNSLKKTPLKEIKADDCEKRGGKVDGEICITSIIEDISKVLFSSDDKAAVEILRNYKGNSSEVYLFLQNNLINTSSWVYCATWDKEKKTGIKRAYSVRKENKNGEEIFSLNFSKEVKESLFHRLFIDGQKSEFFELEYDTPYEKIFKVKFK